MNDQTLTCQNCHSEFVFSIEEQQGHQTKNLPAPTLCPICYSLKSQEKHIPPKPTIPNPLKDLENTS